MTEQGDVDKYIKCSKCRCKYINEEEHIKTDFGYTRLGERFKTCITCRNKRQTVAKVYCEKNKDKIKDYQKCYRGKNKDTLKEYSKENTDKQSYETCKFCGFQVLTFSMNKHRKSNKCKQWELLQQRVDLNNPDILSIDYTKNDEPYPVYQDYEKTIEYREKYLGYDRNKKTLSVV